LRRVLTFLRDVRGTAVPVEVAAPAVATGATAATRFFFFFFSDMDEPRRALEADVDDEDDDEAEEEEGVVMDEALRTLVLSTVSDGWKIKARLRSIPSSAMSRTAPQ
jgi:hypothetical protein